MTFPLNVNTEHLCDILLVGADICWYTFLLRLRIPEEMGSGLVVQICQLCMWLWRAVERIWRLMAEEWWFSFCTTHITLSCQIFSVLSAWLLQISFGHRILLKFTLYAANFYIKQYFLWGKLYNDSGVSRFNVAFPKNSWCVHFLLQPGTLESHQNPMELLKSHTNSIWIFGGRSWTF